MRLPDLYEKSSLNGEVTDYQGTDRQPENALMLSEELCADYKVDHNGEEVPD